DLSRWLTVDPLWPWESAYGYAHGNPILWIDSSGMMTVRCPGCTKKECNDIAAALGAILPYVCPGGDDNNPGGFADCVDLSSCRQPLGGTSPGRCLCQISNASSITIGCQKNCSKVKGKTRCA